jgi:hypothetical protein
MFTINIHDPPAGIYRDVMCSIILPVVLYGCETWSLTLREERRLRVFENRVLRAVAYPGVFFGGGSTKSAKDRGQT